MLMGNMVPQHFPKLFQNRPPDGREIGDAHLFLVRHVPRSPELKRVGATLPKLVEQICLQVAYFPDKNTLANATSPESIKYHESCLSNHCDFSLVFVNFVGRFTGENLT